MIEHLSPTFLQVHDPISPFLLLQDTPFTEVTAGSGVCKHSDESLLVRGPPPINRGFVYAQQFLIWWWYVLSDWYLAASLWRVEVGKFYITRSSRSNEGSYPQSVYSVILYSVDVNDDLLSPALATASGLESGDLGKFLWALISGDSVLGCCTTSYFHVQKRQTRYHTHWRHVRTRLILMDNAFPHI